MGLLRAHIFGVVLLFSSLWICAGDSAGAQRAHPVLVIVGASLTATDIGVGKLRTVFQSQAADLNGVRLIPFNLPVGTPARQIVDKAVLGLGPDRVGSFWVDQRVRSGLNPPRTISTPEMLMRVVASMRGAISYVQMNPTAVPAGLRVLTVDGKGPTDSAYLLQSR